MVVGGNVVVVVVVVGDVEVVVVGELEVEVVVATMCTWAADFEEGVEEQALAPIANPTSRIAIPVVGRMAATFIRVAINSACPTTFGCCLLRFVPHRTSAVAVGTGPLSPSRL